MTTLIRRTLLVSSTAIIALALMPAIGAMVPASLSSLVEQQAQARGGSDDGDDDSGSDDSGHDSSDDKGHDSSDDSDDSSDDDGPDHDRNDDHGGDRSDDDSDDVSDDVNDDSLDDSGSGKSRGRGGDRDEIRLIVNDNQLQGLLNGSMIPVDQNGKRLRFEVEQEHGNTEIKLRAPKGTLTGVTVIPAP